jgi:Rrf2 family protein
MLSNRTKYALKALIALARAENQEPVLIARLAEAERIPKKFLENILVELKGLGLVQSKMGKHGGYSLRRRPSEVMLGHVVRAFEGPLALLPCVSVTAYRPCTDCRDEAACGLRLVMKDVRDEVAKILDSTSLADVLERVANERTNATVMYHI